VQIRGIEIKSSNWEKHHAPDVLKRRLMKLLESLKKRLSGSLIIHVTSALKIRKIEKNQSSQDQSMPLIMRFQ
jgi:hypothetical protein